MRSLPPKYIFGNFVPQEHAFLAFDKVWHEDLVYKLRQNGINGKLLALLTNYLNNRKQRGTVSG